jgi:aspartate aminotransferase
MTAPRTSALLGRLTESATLAMARKARELKDQGIDVISLSLGEPDFDTPEPIKEAGIAAIRGNDSHYTPVPGTVALRQAISRKFLRDNGLSYSADAIVVSNGAKQTIANAVLALINPGDEVILPAPYWVSYEDLVRLADGVPVVLPTSIEEEYKISAAQLEAAITPRTRLLIFSSPCNPSGSVFTREELESLAAVLRQHPNVLVISDEIYELINFTGSHASFAALEGMYDRTITVNGVSKGFAMTGWRLGYLGAPKWIADACSTIQSQMTSAPCSIAQAAAAAAVDADPSIADGMRDAFLRRRDLMIAGLERVPGFKVNCPPGAFYLFPDVSAVLGKEHAGGQIATSDDLALYLLSEAHVAVVAGTPFGAPDCIRLSYAASEEALVEAAARIERAVAALK